MRQLEEDIDREAVDVGIADDEEISEQDDANSERDRLNSTRLNKNDDAQDSMRNNEAEQQTESSKEFFHEAKTESDSDNNKNTQDAQRCIQTGAIAESGTTCEFHYNNIMFTSVSVSYYRFLTSDLLTLAVFFFFCFSLSCKIFISSLYLFLTQAYLKETCLEQ